MDEDDDCGGQEDCRHVGEDISHGFGKVLIGVGVIYAISSLIGFNNVGDCRAAVRKFEGRGGPSRESAQRSPSTTNSWDSVALDV